MKRNYAILIAAVGFVAACASACDNFTGPSSVVGACKKVGGFDLPLTGCEEMTRPSCNLRSNASRDTWEWQGPGTSCYE